MLNSAKYAVLFGCITVSACVAPTDCSLEPARCLPPAYQVAGAKAPTAVKPLVPLVPGLPTAVAPGAVRGVVPVADGAAARGQGAKVDGNVPAADQRTAVVRRALSAALPALKAHDLAGLRAFVTARYAKQFAEIEEQYKERFWRHADRVVKVLGGARPDITIEAQPDGRLQATIKSPEGLEIRPVVVQEDGVWKLDRL